MPPGPRASREIRGAPTCRLRARARPARTGGMPAVPAGCAALPRLPPAQGVMTRQATSILAVEPLTPYANGGMSPVREVQPDAGVSARRTGALALRRRPCPRRGPSRAHGAFSSEKTRPRILHRPSRTRGFLLQQRLARLAVGAGPEHAGLSRARGVPSRAAGSAPRGGGACRAEARVRAPRVNGKSSPRKNPRCRLKGASSAFAAGGPQAGGPVRG